MVELFFFPFPPFELRGEQPPFLPRRFPPHDRRGGCSRVIFSFSPLPHCRQKLVAQTLPLLQALLFDLSVAVPRFPRTKSRLLLSFPVQFSPASPSLRTTSFPLGIEDTDSAPLPLSPSNDPSHWEIRRVRGCGVTSFPLFPRSETGGARPLPFLPLSYDSFFFATRSWTVIVPRKSRRLFPSPSFQQIVDHS